SASKSAGRGSSTSRRWRRGSPPRSRISTRLRRCRSFSLTCAGSGCSHMSLQQGRTYMDPITVNSYLRWGKLIKTWATGRSYFEDDNPQIAIDRLPVPRSLDELKAQCQLVRAGVVIPPGVIGLAIVQYSADTLVIRLPPKDRIEAMEQALAGSGKYPFPGF